MNKYQAFFGSQTKVIEAETSYEAWNEAVRQFAKTCRVTKNNKYLISVVLLELAGTTVVHKPQDITP